MKTKLFLKTMSVFALFSASTMIAQNFQTMPIQSGYTADVIANGAGPSMGSTTMDVDGADYALVARDFQLTSSSTPLTYGIPSDGIINSAVSGTSGLSYQLGDLSSDNSLRLTNNGDTGTLVFTTPTAALKLYMLSTSGSGASTVNATVTFTDNTTQVFSDISLSDWYGGSNYAIQGIGRINRSNDNLEASFSGPRLYQSALNIDAINQSKLIQSVTVEKSGGSGIPNIFAFSASIIIPQNFQPLSVQSGYTADVIANGTGPSMGSTTMDVDGVSYAFVANDFLLTSSSTPITYGIPSDGIINSAVAGTPGLSYQLADLSSDNSLRLANNGDSGTLVFTTPTAALNLYMLSTSGSGGSTINATVTFTDNTTQVFSNISLSDWYGGSGYAIQGIGRINRNNDNLEESTSDPRLYQSALNINVANQSKPVQSVTVTKSGGSGIPNIFAFSANKNMQLSTSEVKGIVKKTAVHPNPFNDILYISDTRNVKSVTIGDTAGRIVNTIEGPVKELNLSMLKSGLYFVTLYFKDGTQSTVKAIKK
ncbi:T9SS type A sorting domain-containing protein [Chryseobacterium sp. Bi04]|uniref:T9SS type A sorting domain-containing protein n=1 Tax=Chryseobacterium sp. Bi04 TaxID=2822345 RepID=UPI001DDF55B2|nr:T9SS type A sorting domain-containing protein [Chryseobacterium sp. Bi04]CAH0280565.1 hypothetical protein SRABI04_04039 [Chryseobacterium sp. Bi04]